MGFAFIVSHGPDIWVWAVPHLLRHFDHSFFSIAPNLIAAPLTLLILLRWIHSAIRIISSD